MKRTSLFINGKTVLKPTEPITIGKQGEVNANNVRFQIFELQPSDLIYKAVFTLPDNNSYQSQALSMQTINNQYFIDYTFESGVLAKSGNGLMELVAYKSDNSILWKSDSYVTKVLSSIVTSSNVPTETANWIVELQNLKSGAESATESANSAATSASEAVVSLSELEDQVVESEALRVQAESSRSSAESARVAAEQSRASAESTRSTAESARISSEQSRASAELTRSSSESSRVSVESSRVAAESARVTAENGRVYLIQYSANGTSWHSTFTTGDVQMRISVNNGVSWSAGMPFGDPTSLISGINSQLAENSNIHGTTQIPTFNTDGTIAKIEHVDSDETVVRLDEFVYAETTIVETRKLYNVLAVTIIHHLDTLQTEVI